MMKKTEMYSMSLALVGLLCAGPIAAQTGTSAHPAAAVAGPHTEGRIRFIAAAEVDIAKGKSKVADLEKQADVAGANAKVGIHRQIDGLKTDVKRTETKLGEMKQATADRWERFETGVSAAVARLRETISRADG